MRGVYSHGVNEIRTPTTPAQAQAMLEEAQRLRQRADELTNAVMAGISPLRNAAGVTQVELAESAKVSQATVSRVDNGSYMSSSTPKVLAAFVSTISAKERVNAQDDLRQARRKGK